jgi:hypothetical protein
LLTMQGMRFISNWQKTNAHTKPTSLRTIHMKTLIYTNNMPYLKRLRSVRSNILRFKNQEKNCISMCVNKWKDEILEHKHTISLQNPHLFDITLGRNVLPRKVCRADNVREGSTQVLLPVDSADCEEVHLVLLMLQDKRTRETHHMLIEP